MKKLLLFAGFAFFAGILVHAFFFPDFLSRTTNLNSLKNKVLGERQPTKSTQSEFLTIVSYKKGAFHPGKVWIKKGNYLAIQNDDEEKQMWLVSDRKDLQTVRGYGLSERVTSIMNDLGTFSVTNITTNSVLVIVVQAN